MYSMESYSVVMKTKYLYQRKFDYNSNFNSVYNAQKGQYKNEEACAVRVRFPTKIPVIVDRSIREYQLPYLNKRKFLVPEEIAFSQFLMVLRDRLKLNRHQSLVLLVNNRSMISATKTMAEIYSTYRNADGFLYITYASQEVFG